MTHQNRTHYHSFSQYLHWLIAALIVAQYILIEYAHTAADSNNMVRQLAIIANHKSIGITLLLLAVVRLTWRFIQSPPPLPSNMPRWQLTASHLSHALLYFFMFALPITGWLMSSANAYSVSWFNLFALPDLIAADEARAKLLNNLHDWLSDGLLVIALVHLVAALKHHILDRDDVLQRMLSKGSLVVATLALVFSLGYLGQHFNTVKTSTRSESVEISQTTPVAQSKASQLPIWQIDYSNSYIKFSGEQAGAPFTGQWNQWQGTLQFDSNNLADSQFDVVIDIASVFTDDDERDETMLSADFFDAMAFPEARFLATQFNQSNGGYDTDGTLTIKGIQRPVKFEFTVRKQAQSLLLTGTALLNRHQWNLGIGDWADPTWVGSDVVVDVQVTAELSE